MYIDRELINEVNIRMMTLLQDPPGWRCKDRLQDEAQDNAGLRKGHLGKENESRAGCSVDQEDQDRLKDELFRIGVV